MSETKSCGKCKNPCKKCRAKRIGELNAQGMAAMNRGEMDQAEARLGEALDEARAGEMAVHEANIHNSLALVRSVRGDMERALTHYAEALDLTDGRICGDHALLQTLHRNLARTLMPEP
jgi:Flp pilus assembly protein TadD